jgi:hypothetical protein
LAQPEVVNVRATSASDESARSFRILCVHLLLNMTSPERGHVENWISRPETYLRRRSWGRRGPPAPGEKPHVRAVARDVTRWAAGRCAGRREMLGVMGQPGDSRGETYVSPWGVSRALCPFAGSPAPVLCTISHPLAQLIPLWDRSLI